MKTQATSKLDIEIGQPRIMTELLPWLAQRKRNLGRDNWKRPRQHSVQNDLLEKIITIFIKFKFLDGRREYKYAEGVDEP